MLPLFIVLLSVVPDSGWQTHTNANFINDMVGSDSTLFLATNGGIVELSLQPSVQTVRAVVNTDGLPVNKCLCVAEDSTGNLWVGTDGGGLAVLVRDSTSAMAYRASEVARKVRALAWDGGRLLVATDQGLYCIDTRGTLLDFADDEIRRFSVARNPELLSDQVISLAVNDRYWVGTNRGLTSVDRGFATWQSYRQPLGDSVRSIAFHFDSVMVATEDGVAVKSGDDFVPVLGFSRPTEVFQLVTAGAAAYLATKSGLYVADSAAPGRFQTVLGEDCRSVHVGQALWVGCGGFEQGGAGLRYLLSGQTWGYYYNPCIGSDAVSDCAIGTGGDVFLCHYGSFFTWLTASGEYRFVPTASPLAYQVRVDPQGRLWFAHFAADGGVSTFNPADWSWRTTRWGEVSGWNIIVGFGMDRWGTTWVFNGDGKVVAIDTSDAQTVFAVSGLPNPPSGLYELAFSWDGKAWLGATVGLVMIDYNGTLADQSDDEYRIISSGLPAPEVRSVAVDSRDRVWVGTSQGAAAWDGERFEVFTHERTGGGLLSNNVYRVRVDASDRVWMLCDAGLVVYDPVTSQWQDFGAGGLIPNTEGLIGFYSALDVSSPAGMVAVGTQRGLSVRGFGVEAPETAHRMRVYPNPCVLNAENPDRRVVIDSLPGDAWSVRVYTLAGLPVAVLGVDPSLHRAVWNPTGSPSGIYLLMVSGPRGAKTERVALVRP